MVVLKVCHVAGLASGVRAGVLTYAGEPMGIDSLGREIRADTDVVVVSVDRREGGWLVGYREVRVREELVPAS